MMGLQYIFDMFTDPGFDVSAVKVPLWSRLTMRILSLRLNTGHHRAAGTVQVRASSIDNALRQNKEIETLKDGFQENADHAGRRRLLRLQIFKKIIPQGAFSAGAIAKYFKAGLFKSAFFCYD